MTVRPKFVTEICYLAEISITRTEYGLLFDQNSELMLEQNLTSLFGNITCIMKKKTKPESLNWIDQLPE